MPELRAIAEQHLTVPDHVVSSAGDVIDINTSVPLERPQVEDAFVSNAACRPTEQHWIVAIQSMGEIVR